MDIQTSDSTGPFTGYRVLELTRGLAGGYAGKLLADAGATVARVDLPDHGDRPRLGTGAGTGGEGSALFRQPLTRTVPRRWWPILFARKTAR